jgi:nucleotide-binding universal stress UspA family protein
MVGEILSPLDGTTTSEIGLAWAEQAAARLGASLKLLTVVDTRHHEANGHVAEAEQYLRTHEDRITAGGVTVSSEVAVGAPADEIVARATTHPLTVMTCPPRRWIFGGALDRVINEMVNPVVVVRGKEGQAPPMECTRVIAPIGQSAHAKQVLPVAMDLCQMLGATLTLHSVVVPVAGAYDKAAPPPEIARHMEEQIIIVESMLTSTAAELTGHGVEIDCLVSVGDPAREIIRVARENGAGLIAMASRGSYSLSGMMASVALGVTQASPIPCMLVRPAPVEAAA